MSAIDHRDRRESREKRLQKMQMRRIEKKSEPTLEEIRRYAKYQDEREKPMWNVTPNKNKTTSRVNIGLIGRRTMNEKRKLEKEIQDEVTERMLQAKKYNNNKENVEKVVRLEKELFGSGKSRKTRKSRKRKTQRKSRKRKTRKSRKR